MSYVHTSSHTRTLVTIPGRHWCNQACRRVFLIYSSNGRLYLCSLSHILSFDDCVAAAWLDGGFQIHDRSRGHFIHLVMAYGQQPFQIWLNQIFAEVNRRKIHFHAMQRAFVLRSTLGVPKHINWKCCKGNNWLDKRIRKPKRLHVRKSDSFQEQYGLLGLRRL